VRPLYRMKVDKGAPVEVNEFVPFAYTPTRFGGQRQWFRCVKCYRPCRKLYGGRYLRCRLCYDLGTHRRVRRRGAARVKPA